MPPRAAAGRGGRGRSAPPGRRTSGRSGPGGAAAAAGAARPGAAAPTRQERAEEQRLGDGAGTHRPVQEAVEQRGKAAEQHGARHGQIQQSRHGADQGAGEPVGGRGRRSAAVPGRCGPGRGAGGGERNRSARCRQPRPAPQAPGRSRTAPPRRCPGPDGALPLPDSVRWFWGNQPYRDGGTERTNRAPSGFGGRSAPTEKKSDRCVRFWPRWCDGVGRALPETCFTCGNRGNAAPLPGARDRTGEMGGVR